MKNAMIAVGNFLSPLFAEKKDGAIQLSLGRCAFWFFSILAARILLMAVDPGKFVPDIPANLLFMILSCFAYCTGTKVINMKKNGNGGSDEPK